MSTTRDGGSRRTYYARGASALHSLPALRSPPSVIPKPTRLQVTLVLRCFTAAILMGVWRATSVPAIVIAAGIAASPWGVSILAAADNSSAY